MLVCCRVCVALLTLICWFVGAYFVVCWRLFFGLRALNSWFVGAHVCVCWCLKCVFGRAYCFGLLTRICRFVDAYMLVY